MRQLNCQTYLAGNKYQQAKTVDHMQITDPYCFRAVGVFYFKKKYAAVWLKTPMIENY